MRKPCFVCSKEMDILQVLVGDKIYCSQDCFEEHRDSDLKRGLILLLKSASILKEHLAGHTIEIEDALNVLTKAEEDISLEKTLNENLKALRELGKV